MAMDHLTLEKVKRAQEQSPTPIQQGHPLYKPYDGQMAALEWLLVDIIEKFSMFFLSLYPERPAFRESWQFDYNTPKAASHYLLPTGLESYEADRLEWCLCQLTMLPDEKDTFDHATIFAILEDHLKRSNTAERARLDEILLHQLSNLSTLHELLSSVRSNRLHSTLVERAYQSTPWEDSGKLIDAQETVWKPLIPMLMNNFYRADLPGGEKNRLWLERSQNIRRALDSFWKGMKRASASRMEKCGFDGAQVEEILRVIDVASDPNYIKAVQEEDERVLRAIEAQKQAR